MYNESKVRLFDRHFVRFDDSETANHQLYTERAIKHLRCAFQRLDDVRVLVYAMCLT